MQTGGTDGDDDGVQYSQFRQFASQTQNKDASLKQWDNFDLLEEDDFDMLEEDEFVLLGEDDLTLAGRELRNNLNPGQRETEAPDGESRWGEPDDYTKQKENEHTEKATKAATRASPALSSGSKPLRLSWRPRCAAR
jgi:hypothetical protein